MMAADDVDDDDALFRERLDFFIDKSLADIKIFAEREDRDYEQTRRLVAQEHIAYLFRPQVAGRNELVRSILADISAALETLNSVAGVETFFLAVDPEDSTSDGFLGGSIAGREFWRGLRHGGETGAKSFQQYCTNNREQSVQPDPSTQHARQLKTQLYDLVRQSLRAVSGVRQAEMKWTNHSRLSTYGVSLVGWPEDIPVQNPSTLKSSLNRRLLQLFKDGKIYFIRTQSPSGPNYTLHAPSPNQNESGSSESLSWAIHDEPEDGDDQSSTRSRSPDERSRPQKRSREELDGG